MMDRILQRLKDLVITLRDKEILKDERLFKKWKEQKKKLDEELESLSASDKKLLEERYREWFKKEILPNVKRDMF